MGSFCSVGIENLNFLAKSFRMRRKESLKSFLSIYWLEIHLSGNGVYQAYSLCSDCCRSLPLLSAKRLDWVPLSGSTLHSFRQLFSYPQWRGGVTAQIKPYSGYKEQFFASDRHCRPRDEERRMKKREKSERG
jgi:hypothetical protein